MHDKTSLFGSVEQEELNDEFSLFDLVEQEELNKHVFLFGLVEQVNDDDKFSMAPVEQESVNKDAATTDSGATHRC